MAKIEGTENEKQTQINPEKLKALQATLDKLEKDFGKGTVMKLGDQPKWDASVIPSGSIALDNALGIGGYPRGRVVEIYGPESSGKTTLAIHAIAEAQKSGGIAAIIIFLFIIIQSDATYFFHITCVRDSSAGLPPADGNSHSCFVRD